MKGAPLAGADGPIAEKAAVGGCSPKRLVRVCDEADLKLFELSRK